MTVYKFSPMVGYVKIDIDVDKVARAIYKDYEDCPDSYVDQVWAWESIPPNGRANLEARDAFRQTVDDFTLSARRALKAALGDRWEAP